MIEYKKSLLKLSFILTCCIQLSYAAIKSNTGTISFDSNSDSTSELTLSSTGLAIGSNLTASSNLHVSGNALISKELYIGGSSGSSNLHIHGTLGHSFATITSSGNISGNSYNLIDSSSGNIRLTLPSASTYEGRVYQFKKTSALNDVYIHGGPIDEQPYLKLAANTTLPRVKMISSSGNWHILDTNGSSGSSSESAAANLIAWWPFDETSGTSTADRSSYSHTGTLSNLDFSIDSSDGILGKALTYTATNDSISVPGTDFQFGTSDFSVAVWVNTSSATRQFVFSNYTGSHPSYYCEIALNGRANFQVHDGTNSKTGLSDTTVRDGTWHHIVWVFNRSGHAQYYIDGVKDSTEHDISAVTTISNANNIMIGKYAANTAITFIGSMDDLRIYNKALSASEVLEIYHIAKD